MDILVKLLMAFAEFAEEWGVVAGVVSLGFWWVKKQIDKKEAERKAQEEATRSLILIMIKESRSANILAMATAKAVQRIPDAQCNGDMTSAIEQAEALLKEEKNFLSSQALKHIFGDN